MGETWLKCLLNKFGPVSKHVTGAVRRAGASGRVHDRSLFFRERRLNVNDIRPPRIMPAIRTPMGSTRQRVLTL